MIQRPLEAAAHDSPRHFTSRAPAGPDPVVVDIPQDLSRADIPYEPVEDVHLPGYQPTTDGNQKQIRPGRQGPGPTPRRPVIYAGGGVVSANASAELTELATVDRFPVTCTVMGLGGFSGTHDQVAGDARHARHPDGQLRRWTRPT